MSAKSESAYRLANGGGNLWQHQWPYGINVSINEKQWRHSENQRKLKISGMACAAA